MKNDWWRLTFFYRVKRIYKRYSWVICELLNETLSKTYPLSLTLVCIQCKLRSLLFKILGGIISFPVIFSSLDKTHLGNMFFFFGRWFRVYSVNKTVNCKNRIQPNFYWIQNHIALLIPPVSDEKSGKYIFSRTLNSIIMIR